MGVKNPYVVRVRFVQPDGVGYLTKDGQCSAKIDQAQRYETESDAWLHAAGAEVLGVTDKGEDDAWVEQLP